MLRTHTCGQLTRADVDSIVTLTGWVANRRDHGGVIFIDLRDRYGFTQTVFDPQDGAEAWKVADTFRSEYVVKLTGRVRLRPDGQANPNMSTGEIEVVITDAEILTKSKTPPFEISEHAEANEDIRLKYRYLDLRRRKVLQNIEFRAKMNGFTRNWFSDRKFLEVQTPIFTVSSPEGARDFLIPSRLHHGKFYALPQAPQQYKQLLMIGGVDKYFQIAPCFRDEDPRADRHSCEFYQIDCEMSFVEQDDVFATVESFIRDLVPAVVPHKSITADSFVRIPYVESIDRYGTDKPDIRFDLRFEDFTADFRASEFSVFRQAVDAGGVVKAFKLPKKSMSRSQIDDLTEVARRAGAKGLAYIIYEEEGPRSPILKFFSEGEMAALEAKLKPEAGDMVFFGAGEYAGVCKVLGVVRNTLRDWFDLADKNTLAFAWITDFPFYEEGDDGKIDFCHNPFSMPLGGMKALEEQDPLTIYAQQYDLACNGFEILSGSIRNHDVEVMVKAFSMVGKDEDVVRERFGAMYSAFQYGPPPHGGFAIGFDRFMMTLCDEPNIREIYAFPKSGRAEDAMMNAPAFVDAPQLAELGIDLSAETKAELAGK